ncbi:HD domain-containing protein [Actinoplanes sp. CA-131856]
MPRQPRRALLIGVAEYDDTSIDSLPFIADDLDDLDKALTSIGYQVDRHPPQHGDRDRIDTAIEQFCRRAEPAQQLLIFLSGHGIHRDGNDYLLPSSADTTSRKFTERCLEIEFNGHIEDSRCGDVLVVVDACREGVRLREKSGYSYVHRWSQQQRARSADRTIAYLYACSSGELAHWKDTPDGTFSLFTRAFSRALTDTSVAGTLSAVREATRVRLETMSAELGVPLQKPHLDGDGDQCSRLMLVDRPGHVAASRGAPGWAERAKGHAVWDLVRSGPDSPALPESAAAMRDATADCAEAWSREYRQLQASLGDDPWWDEELAIRMQDRLSWIVKHVLNPGKLAEGDKPPLSPAEAALLVLLPFAQQLHRASAAVASRSVLDTPDPSKDHDAEFARYVEGRRRIVRRLRRLDASADHAHADAVRWAAYHRWLAQRPQLYRTEAVAGVLLSPLDPPDSAAALLLREVISADRLSRLLRALRSDPEDAASGDQATDIPAGAQTVAGGSPDEQTVRNRLLALILLVAEEFTIDVTALPSIVTDHIGLHDGVEPGEVLRAVQRARWSARGRTRVLEADCPHQSVQLALAEHTNGIAEVLRRIDTAAEADRTLEALRDLPTHVAADGLRPLPGPDGLPRYDMVGFRFRLDDDRVQELLMGEQLYGDPALAIRELYQNALDACRYRRARTLHLRKQGRWTAEWEGRITLTQGVDEDGRMWLECRDNGIGMSERELSSVFSNAGARFADLPEFLEEQATWAKEEIDFYPNSRFGIGVLSYFMLGDEIEVSTARFSRDGTIAPRLQVEIDGPGSLCRIRTAGEGTESGTTIRVYLRPDVSVSCTALLSRLLWVAEFPVTASDGATSVSWRPGVLSHLAPISGGSPADDEFVTDSDRIVDRVLPSTTQHVWWCSGRGGILADGLWAGEASFGYVVNLVGRMTPRLTVDRRRILSTNRDDVRRLLRSGLPDLFAGNDRLLRLHWLRRLAAEDLVLADEIAGQMIDGGSAIAAVEGGVTVDTARVGVFPPDDSIFLVDEDEDYLTPFDRNYAQGAYLSLSAWRLYHYLRAGCVPGVMLTVEPPATPLARPSDAFLLSISADGKAPWLPLSEPVPVEHVMRVGAGVGWPPGRIAERLIDLGLEVSEFPWPTVPVSAEDARLLSRDLDGKVPWLDPSEPVSAAHVVVAAVVLRWSTTRVMRRLTDLGRVVAEQTNTLTPADLESDRRILFSHTDRQGPWLTRLREVPGESVWAAAAAMDWSPRRVADRLAALGLAVAGAEWPDTPVSDDDQWLLTRRVDGETPWLPHSEQVSTQHVLLAAARLRWSPRDAAERLTALGLSVAGTDWPEDVISDEDRDLLFLDPEDELSWLSSASPISVGHVFAVASRLGSSPRRVAHRFDELGLRTDDFAWTDVIVTEDDGVLVSRDLDGIAPWLETWRPVPASHVVAAASQFGRTWKWTAERLAALGLPVTEFPWPDVVLSGDDVVLLSRVTDASKPSLVPQPAPWGYVAVAAAALGWPVSRVTDRLAELGLSVAAEVRPETSMTDDDHRLLSVNLDGRAPWMDPADEVTAQQLFTASAMTRWSARAVAARLTELGMAVPDRVWPDIAISGDDQEMLSRDLDRQKPWLDPEKPVPIRHVFEAAAALRRPLLQIAKRLTKLGFQVPESAWPDIGVTDDDLGFVQHFAGDAPQLTLRESRMHPGVLAPGVNDSSLSIGQAVLRLRQLGFDLPTEIEVIPDELPNPKRFRQRL